MTNDEKKLKLSQVPRAIAQCTVTGSTASYQQVWNAATSGIIPADQLENGRWVVNESDIADIAKKMNFEVIPDFDLKKED